MASEQDETKDGKLVAPELDPGVAPQAALFALFAALQFERRDRAGAGGNGHRSAPQL